MITEKALQAYNAVQSLHRLSAHFITYDNKDFACHGTLDEDGTWNWHSLCHGINEVTDWLDFYSNHCPELLEVLTELCQFKASWEQRHQRVAA